MDRRSFLQYSCSSVILPFALKGNITANIGYLSVDPVCMFIKPLEQYSYEDMATILSESGFDGADITLRKKGLIEPETAAKTLPRVIKAFEKKRLSVPMAVTGITDPSAPGVKDHIRLMADSGIRYYRLGYYQYDEKCSITENLERIKRQLAELEKINSHYNIQGAIQNHAGSGFGAPVWDAYYVIRDLDPKYIGFQYDVRHAMAEGMSSWLLGLKLLSEYVASTCIKDFTWKQDGARFKPLSVPLGEGIVDFEKYFGMIRKLSIRGPVSIHYEYPLLTGEQQGEDTVRQMKDIICVLGKDMERYKQFRQ